MKKRKARRPAYLQSSTDCEICQNLPNWAMKDEMCEDPFSLATDRLVGKGDIRRCPLCGTRYSITSESDTHHFMSNEVTIKRLN